MMSFQDLPIARCALAVLLFSACGGDDSSSAKPSLDASVVLTDASAMDAAAADQQGDEQDAVPCTPDYPNFTAGMTTRTSIGDLTIKLLSITPEPPRQMVNNTWEVQLTHADGSPASDVVVSTPDAYMPVHNHHGLTQPVATVKGPGQVEISQINFRMRGPWQVNFNVQPAGGTPKLATFQICVQ